MQDRNRIIVVVLIIYFTFGLLSIYKGNIQIDEKESHLPTVRAFYEMDYYSVLQSSNYRSASTPLPYILVASIHRAVGIEPTIISVRIINIIISLMTLLVFSLLLKERKIAAFPFLLILFFYPYYLKPSFVFYMAGYGLLFYFLFLYFYPKSGLINQFWSSISFTAAILSQQFYLILFAPLILTKFYEFYGYRFDKQKYYQALIWMVGIIPVFLLLFIWNGFTHPQYRNWGIELHPEYLSAILVVLGGVLFPFVLSKIREIKLNTHYIIIAISFGFAIFLFPNWVSEPTPGGIAGYSFHVIELISRFSFLLGLTVKTLLIYFGITAIVIVTKENIKTDFMLTIIFLFFIVGFMLNKLPSERHMLPLVATVMLLAFNKTDKKVAIYFWLPFLIVLGTCYFFYMILFSKLN